jgi:hypothetical protein
MATDVQSEQSVAKLVSGIIDDAQRLMVQHADLLKADIRKDLRDAKEAGFHLGIGGVLIGAGGLLLMIALALLLNWLWPALPYWGGFAIVGGVLAMAGGVLFYRGQEKLDSINPLPEESVQAVKEDLRWQTNPK